jgi:hypothetical protein
LGDFADSLSKNICVSQRFDFARGSDDGSQILADCGGSLNGDYALIDLPDGKPCASGQNGDYTHTHPDFLPRIHVNPALKILLPTEYFKRFPMIHTEPNP